MRRQGVQSWYAVGSTFTSELAWPSVLVFELGEVEGEKDSIILVIMI